jgi:hypothetical protein
MANQWTIYHTDDPNFLATQQAFIQPRLRAIEG